MGIEIRQAGEPELYAKAGAAIDSAQKAEKEHALALQREQILIESAERRRVEQADRDFKLQMALMSAQQDFAHEQRLKQADLEAEARAKEWEVQKMQLRSQLDFEIEEKERLKNIEAVTNQISTLEKYKDQIDSSQYTNKMFELQTKLDAVKSGSTKVDQERLPTAGKESSPLIAKRKALEAWFGDEAKTSSISGMEQSLRDEGIDPESLYSGKEMTPATETTEKFATNPQTGETIVSYDGGKTWQPLTKETTAVEQLTTPKESVKKEPVREWGSNAPAWTQKRWDYKKILPFWKKLIKG